MGGATYDGAMRIVPGDFVVLVAGVMGLVISVVDDKVYVLIEGMNQPRWISADEESLKPH